ncbi:MAG: TonB-dependent receptor [Flavobacterium sp. BFFFF1]|uniref:TonB-dependent receptor n=1 Tax=Flavobacterium sp. BFFFF1 TaxID=2015557 RepID=UPI000BDCF377|nr:TonB-dependent receptor [Flavobacterium sp. BFFFF1]OYU80778.1 MAG: TonB-dependent receptor [Flavobacterium sp. BFFFF1]
MPKFLLPLLLLFSWPVLAQPRADSIRTATTGKDLDEVIIASFLVNDSIKNLPAAIGVITERQLLANNGVELASSINRIPGVYMQSGGYNTNRIAIRGIGSRTPYGTNKVRAFYGNIPLTSGDSETTVEDLDLQAMGQVEIIKVPQSAVYGAGLGGAIRITPRAAANEVSSNTTVGSYGLLKSTLSAGVNKKNSAFNVSYHHLESAGWRENSAYKRNGITVSGTVFKRVRSKLEFIGNYTHLKAFIPSSIDKPTFENSPESAAPTWKASKGFEAYDAYLSGLSYAYEFSNRITFSTSVYLTHKESNEPRPFDILQENTTGFGMRTQFSGRLGKNAQSDFIAGIELFRDNFKARTFENLYRQNNGQGSLEGFLLTDAQQNRAFYNAFAQVRVPIYNKLSLHAGVNVNNTNVSLSDNFPERRQQAYGYRPVWSPQLSLLFHPGKNQSVYASVSHGFSLPSTSESLLSDGSINSNIKPETGYQFELGYKAWFLDNRLHVETAVYALRIINLLIAERIGDDQYLGVNAGRTSHDGIELLADYYVALWHGFSLSPYLSASVGKYEFREFSYNGSNYAGKKLTGVPANNAAAGITISAPWSVYGSISWRYTDGIPLNDANTEKTGAYALTDVKLGYKHTFNGHFEAQAAFGINNIFNTKYAAMILPNAMGFGTNLPRFYYPGLPLNYYSGFSFKYIF